jgi:hypothetical protein
MTDWILADPSLCLLSLLNREPSKTLWTSPSKPNTQTAIPNLLAWSIKAPAASGEEISEAQWTEVWSKLHFSLLTCVLLFPAVPGANQLELVTLADMNRLVRETLADPVEERVNRLVQVLQVCLTTGAFRCSLGWSIFHFLYNVIS